MWKCWLAGVNNCGSVSRSVTDDGVPYKERWVTISIDSCSNLLLACSCCRAAYGNCSIAIQQICVQVVCSWLVDLFAGD